MRIINSMADDNKKGGINPIAAGVVGVAIGAATVAMSDPNIRKKVKSQAEKIKKEGMKKMDELKHNIEQKGVDLKKDIEQKGEELKKDFEEQKKSLSSKSK